MFFILHILCRYKSTMSRKELFIPPCLCKRWRNKHQTRTLRYDITNALKDVNVEPETFYSCWERRVNNLDSNKTRQDKIMQLLQNHLPKFKDSKNHQARDQAKKLMSSFILKVISESESGKPDKNEMRVRYLYSYAFILLVITTMAHVFRQTIPRGRGGAWHQVLFCHSGRTNSLPSLDRVAVGHLSGLRCGVFEFMH